MIGRTSLAILMVLVLAPIARGAGPLINLDADSPYYPHRTYPKLTTPQWIGEEGVEAVVILAIDDMRDHRRYETVLRPILDRLKQIDGRAPVSIMTCKIDPTTPLLQQWLKEGLSVEVHTIDHPCPLLAGNDFAKAKSTYDRCVDQLFAIPNNVPVAFRTPCCDSLNTPSPRLFAEIFNKTTPDGHFLSIDSSVFNITTANDPALPRDIAFDSAGRERFRKYVPFESFVNTIEDYPYPYIIGRGCWEFPCATPSDWQAQSLHKPANPQTTADWKVLLDATVLKQGVMTMVFHPYGWSTPQQFVELIDHATKTYGKKVKFLTFREAHDRLTKNLGNGLPLRGKDGSDTGIRLLDLNHDGYLDVVLSAQHEARIWNPETHAWTTAEYPNSLQRAEALVPAGTHGYLRDINKDGQPDLIVGNKIFTWDAGTFNWKSLPFTLPPDTSLDTGAFLADIDEDGFDDLLFSDSKTSALYLFESMEKGWTRNVKANLPPIVRPDGTNNGLWVHSRTLWWQNEDTAKLPNLVDRRTFNDLLKDVEPTAKSPAASLACIRLTPGYQVELVATEPLVQDPIAFSFGPDGKLWVVEMPDYPLGIDAKGTPGGRIKYLEDTNGDGVYDKVTLFLEHVPFPTSVLPWKNGVLIAAAPDIFYAQDTDGDGKADKRELLFTGFKEGNQQHRLNHLSFGLDNWIYGANGDSGGDVKSLKTGKTVSISGRDFRFKPDTGEFEPVTGQSQFGRSRTDAGDYFGCNNANPLLHFPLEETYLKRNPHVPPAPGTLRVDVPTIPGASPVFPTSRLLPRFNDFHTANHFTSACSAHVYRDDLLLNSDSSFILQHSSFAVFISEPVHNLVHREIMTPAGVTFTSTRAPTEQASEFLSSSDNWFRPTTVAAGPDGALYIADMYRQIIEHPQWIPKETQAKYDLRAGRDKGRIYRVSPVGAKRRPIPRLDTLDTPSLVAQFDTPSGWQRDIAQAMLLWRHDASAIPHLQKLATESMNPLARLHALCALDALSDLAPLTPATLAAALGDPDPIVRRHAVRLSEHHLNASPEIATALLRLADETDPHVRLQRAYALGYWDDPSAAQLLAHLATQAPDDRFLLSAILSSLNEKNIRPFAAAVTANAEHAPPSPALLAGLFRTALGANSAQAIGAALQALTAQHDAGHYAPWQFQTVANVLDSLDEAKLSLAKLAKSDPSIAPATKGVETVVTVARAIAADATAPPADRSAAISLLAHDPATRERDLKTLSELLSPQSPRELQAAIIATLSRRQDPDAARLLLDHWKTLTPDLRAAGTDGLLSRPDRAALLLDAIEHKSVLATEIDAPRRQRLLQSPDKTIRARAAALFAATVNPDRQKVIDAFAPALTLKGDAKNGQLLFAKTCATCHRLGDTGNAVGPDLASVGDKSPEGLLIAILDPNRAVEPRYINYIVTTTDQETLTGLLASESATSITLLGPDAKQQTLRRQDLKDLRSSNTSLMPEGLEAGLKPQDLADLIAFVRAGK
ncbi:MAG: putative rane-bound dehydrogenase [Phycisphaerales bacterium]|nr:putative rane-bound dehydrogenase [Phycisphaerales bacterium]